MSPARYKRSPKEDRTWRGKVYDSKREMAAAINLQTLANAGRISDLREQVKVELTPKIGKVRASHYVADFVYTDEGGRTIYADAKGHRTQLYELKKKMVLFRHGIEITEI